MVENIAIFTELLLCIGGGKGKKDLNAKNQLILKKKAKIRNRQA